MLEIMKLQHFVKLVSRRVLEMKHLYAWKAHKIMRLTLFSKRKNISLLLQYVYKAVCIDVLCTV